MIGQIFQTIQTAITQFMATLTAAINGIVSLFWTAPVGDSGTGELTFLGTIMLIGAGVGLVYWAFYFIRNLILGSTSTK